MEKLQNPKQTNLTSTNSKTTVWDCGSSLYDSFELKSFERRLNSAISSARTLSMPHLTTYKQPQEQQKQTFISKKSSKFSRSFQKLLQSLFRPKHRRKQDGFYVVYDTSNTLSTIPEIPDEVAPVDYRHLSLSPELDSIVRRTLSDGRFTAGPSITGISCA